MEVSSNSLEGFMHLPMNRDTWPHCKLAALGCSFIPRQGWSCMAQYLSIDEKIRRPNLCFHRDLYTLSEVQYYRNVG